MPITAIDGRILEKTSTVPGGVPTIAPSFDHTDGTWTEFDIYESEFFINVADEKVFTRCGSTIIELATSSNNFIVGTYAEISALKAASGLLPGRTYFISDRLIWLFAVTTNTFRSGCYRQMRIVKPGLYDLTFTGSKGVWHIGYVGSISIGDYMIRGGKVWRNLTGALGTAPTIATLDSTNWMLDATSSARYTDKVFDITYDFDNDDVTSQKDDKGNHFTYDPAQPTSLLDYCDWGLADLGKMYNNQNLGIYNNRIDYTTYAIHSNTNKGVIRGNRSAMIMLNTNIGAITDNTTSGFISQNNNNGGISQNQCDSIVLNTNLGYINQNIISGDILNNVNRSYIGSNTNTGDISHNACGYISNNSNTGNISYNINGYEIFNNSNTGQIERNSNTSRITNNENQGAINQNSNNGDIISNGPTVNGIIYNMNDGQIKNNTNNGSIGANANLGDIEFNSSDVGTTFSISGNTNAGYISYNNSTANISISYNINNGYIGGTVAVNRATSITDTQVNK